MSEIVEVFLFRSSCTPAYRSAGKHARLTAGVVGVTDVLGDGQEVSPAARSRGSA